LVSDLRGVWTEVRDVSALVVGGHLESAPRARRRLLEDQCDLLAAEVLSLVAGLAGRLEVGRECDHREQLIRCEVKFLQPAATAQHPHSGAYGRMFSTHFPAPLDQSGTRRSL